MIYQILLDWLLFKMKTKVIFSALFLCLVSYGITAPQAAELSVALNAKGDHGYVAKDDSLRSFFDAMAAKLNEPVIVSKLAARKKITGTFDFSRPKELLDKLSFQLGLLWYFDGQAIYIYDASEIRNAVISLQNISLTSFNDFLRKSGLYDQRYPLRGDNNSNTFYVSGPPVFVELIVNTATLIDKKDEGIQLGKQKIGVIRLNNTFVNDRVYKLRGQEIVIPGMATVIENLLEGEKQPLANSILNKQITEMPDFVSEMNGMSSVPLNYSSNVSLPEALKQTAAAGDIKVIAYPGTNSLLVKGTAEQVDFIELLVRTLDITKRHVELSLWIIDLNKSDLDQLGVEWSGGINFGDKLSMSFNQSTPISTLDGGKFIASVYALEQKKQATVVSRPVIMTQENIPAIFDNNRTFYTKLIGERTSSLADVTYGTLISVLPRFSADGQIEMLLDIEDGNEARSVDYNNEENVDVLPEVGRTHISTIARVPQGKSLLIGGYTRDANSQDLQKVPFLGDLPFVGGLFRYNNQNKSNTVRVFLIQPKEIVEPLMFDANDVALKVTKEGGADITDDPLHKWVISFLNRDTGLKLNNGN